MNTIAYKPTTNIIDEHMIKKASPDSWKAILEFDTLDEVLALYHALGGAIDEHFADARNKHIWALGSNTGRIYVLRRAGRTAKKMWLQAHEYQECA